MKAAQNKAVLTPNTELDHIIRLLKQVESPRKNLGKSSSFVKKSSIRSSLYCVASRYHLPKIARNDSKLMPEVTDIMHN